ncbi:uncharacterized protein LOC116186082 [Apis dorsata]|uniref:uncharacterized protein LOC116186082 n=1 Tax=Apis dorsata TaxID=7462 RepID=UPI00129308C8|nr:uncharacterized protein LOC116186082 [Apis dorsata]
MHNISTRLDTLNRQLIIISELQKMEEEYNVYPYTTCKKCVIPNYFGKCCYCAQKILYLKEKLNMPNCADECTYDTRKKRIVCTPEKCKTRRKLHSYKNTSSIEGILMSLI